MEGFSAATAALFAGTPTEHTFGPGHVFPGSRLLCGWEIGHFLCGNPADSVPKIK
jgi:hypothetical protein